jgi:hypothetical protein
MTVDRYTKVILTIIATALVWMCVRDFGTPVAAQPLSVVRIAGADGEPRRSALPVVIVGVKREHWTVNAGSPNPYEADLGWEPLRVNTQQQK